jgi:serine/threonine protein kinase
LRCIFDGRVKVGDFGVASARFLEPNTSVPLLRGKPMYMPPETLTGTARASQRDDLWAASVCLLEMLTMKEAFAGQSPEEVGALLSTRSSFAC